MFDSVRGRVLGVTAAALIAGALPHGRATAQDLELPGLGDVCGFIAKQNEANLKDLEARLARDLERIRATGDRNFMAKIRSELRATKNSIATQQKLISDIEAQIAQARAPVGTSNLDASIREQEKLLAEVQAKRLAIHTGTDGKTGIDELQRLIAELDRRTAANDFATAAERTAAANDRARHGAALQARLAEKAGLATEYAAKRDELARLKRERDSRNPQQDKLKALEAALRAANQQLEDLRESEKKLRAREDKLRDQTTTLLLGEADIRACIADRRKALAAATQPTPPSTPDEPKTPVTPPPAAAATATFSLRGVWNGQCNGKFAVSGQFTINAASGKINGTYNGGDSGAIGGQINGAGQLTASGAGGGGGRSVRWTGSVTQAGARWSGGGRWTSSGDNIACDGAWQSQ